MRQGERPIDIWWEFHRGLWTIYRSLRRRDEPDKARAVAMGVLMNLIRKLEGGGYVSVNDAEGHDRVGEKSADEGET